MLESETEQQETLKHCPFQGFIPEKYNEPGIVVAEQTVLSQYDLAYYFWSYRQKILSAEEKTFSHVSLLRTCRYISLESLHLQWTYPDHYLETLPEISQISYAPQAWPRILNYDDENWDLSALQGYSSDYAVLFHGGLVGTISHIKIIEELLNNIHYTRDRRGALFIGLERDEYILGKRGLADRFLRPWPLVVTISIYHELSRQYNAPVYLFMMPEPLPPSTDPDLINQRYNQIYVDIQRKSRITEIIPPLSKADRTMERKRARVQAFGFDLPSWIEIDEMPFSHANDLTRDIIEKFELILEGFSQIVINYESLYEDSDITGFKC